MKKHYSKRIFYVVLFLSIVAVVSIYHYPVNPAGPSVTVYKSPTCQCCNKWVSHLENNGFRVTAKNTRDVRSIKEKYGIRHDLSACHTAVIAGYFVEGHVPAQSIHRLLSEKPDIKGITVPGMPIGSPGMESGSRVDRYNVIAVNKSGNLSIYDSY